MKKSEIEFRKKSGTETGNDSKSRIISRIEIVLAPAKLYWKSRKRSNGCHIKSDIIPEVVAKSIVAQKEKPEVPPRKRKNVRLLNSEQKFETHRIRKSHLFEQN